MFWLGKIIGAAFGYWLGGVFGAVLGAIIGHYLYDARQVAPGGHRTRAQIQQTFSKTTFAVMGRLAKADGVVTEREIAVAERIMAQMSLTAEQRSEAIHWFNEGKRDDFPLDQILDEFRATCRWRQPLLMMFLEIQLQVALADQHIDPVESRLLGQIFERLGLPRQFLDQLLAMMRGAQHYYDYSHRGETHRPTSAPSLTDAYDVLGVADSASDAEVKKAYRRLMSQHHPDKLVAKGLPPEMVNIAKEKVQEINAAYDQIIKSRGAG
jgi:DnaJ like chaperone protein